MMTVKVMFLVGLFVLTGCASQAYRETPAGRFVGALEVRWVKNDYFLFTPTKENPLTFYRADGTSIQPGVMYTDGGSVPRFLWGVKGLSPWGYAPAYIVHDWMFEAQHCGYSPDNKYEFKDSVALMGETLKAVMEKYPSVRNYFVFDSVVAAVASPIAARLWDKGACKAPSADVKGFTDQMPLAPSGDLIMTIKFE